MVIMNIINQELLQTYLSFFLEFDHYFLASCRNWLKALAVQDSLARIEHTLCPSV